MKILHIMDGPPLYTNCFLVIGEGKKAVAIDPNAHPGRFEEALKEEGASLEAIFLTHGHHDHVAAVEPLREKYGAKLYMNAADAAQFKMAPDETYEDGGKIEIDGMEFTTIFTPGHTPGSTCIRCEGVMFSGDTLFAGDIGRCDLEGGDFAEMKRSLRKLKELVPDEVAVLPGHEEFSHMGDEKKNNPYLREA